MTRFFNSLQEDGTSFRRDGGHRSPCFVQGAGGLRDDWGLVWCLEQQQLQQHAVSGVHHLRHVGHLLREDQRILQIA